MDSSDSTSVKLYFINNQTRIGTLLTQPLGVLTWTHLSFSFDSGKAKIFVNGQQVLSQQGILFNNIVTYRNYIGHSNYDNDPNANAIFDELKIFKRPLNAAEISTEMNMIEPFQKIIF